MSYSNPLNLFNALKEKELSGNGGKGFGNPNLLKLQRGKAYSLRLLWLPSEERQYPMINQYVHHFWDDKAVGSKDVSVICPTSQYDMGNNGFNACPICKKMTDMYKKSTEGSKSAEELYKQFKRILRGYVPVYVVNGPDEDKHKVKILPYTISFKKFFDESIFGKTLDKNGTDSQDEVIETNEVGINAFMYYDPKTNQVMTEGYNFLITVGTKKITINNKATEVPDYKFEFGRKMIDIPDFDGIEITPEYFIGLSNEIGFDASYYKMPDETALNDFCKKYIPSNDNDDEPEINETAGDNEDADDLSLVRSKKPATKSSTRTSAADEDDELAAFEKSAKKQVPSDEDDELAAFERSAKSSKSSKSIVEEAEEDEEDEPSRKPAKAETKKDDMDELNDFLDQLN